MEMKKTSPRYSPEVLTRAVRMVLDHQADHPSQWAAMGSIASKIGCAPETLQSWVRQAERDQGLRPGPTREEQDQIKALERENRELRARLEFGPTKSFVPTLSLGKRLFCPDGARPPAETMKAFIDEHRDVFGTLPICGVLPIAPARYHVARRPTALMPRGWPTRR